MSPVQCVTDVPVHSLPLAAFAVAFVLRGGALRGGWTAPLRRVAEGATRLETGRRLLPPQRRERKRLSCISMEYPPTFKCMDVPSWRVFTKEEMRTYLEDTLKPSGSKDRVSHYRSILA